MTEPIRTPGILLLRHGNKADLPQLLEGEASYTDDTYDLIVNVGGKNINMNGHCVETGDALSGTSSHTEYSYGGCLIAREGDVYINTSNGNVYKCTVPGKGSEAKWRYKGCMKGESITIDDSLSTDSENPVQNKVVTAEIGNIKNTVNGMSGDISMIYPGKKYCGSQAVGIYDNVLINVNGECRFPTVDADVITYTSSCSKSSDYAICREWADGNPNGEDRVGKFVIQDGKKIRLATSADTNIRIMGVISGSYCILENSAPMEWHNKYIKDIYGRVQTQTVHHEAEIKVIDGKEVVVREAYDAEEPIINPEWDETQEYIPRIERPEWDAVGKVGILVVDDDGTCVPGGYCMPNDNSIATASKSGFYVEERLDESHIKISIG